MSAMLASTSASGRGPALVNDQARRPPRIRRPIGPSRRPTPGSRAQDERRDRGHARGADALGRARAERPSPAGATAGRGVRGEPSAHPRGPSRAGRARADRRRTESRGVRPGRQRPGTVPAARPRVPPPRHDGAAALRGTADARDRGRRPRDASTPTPRTWRRSGSRWSGWRPAPTPLERVRNDLAFHAALVAAAHNPVIETMFASIQGLTVELMVRSAGDTEIVRKSAPYHRLAYQAIVDRDPDAGRAGHPGAPERGGVDLRGRLRPEPRRDGGRALRLIGSGAGLEEFLSAVLPRDPAP